MVKSEIDKIYQNTLKECTKLKTILKINSKYLVNSVEVGNYKKTREFIHVIEETLFLLKQSENMLIIIQLLKQKGM